MSPASKRPAPVIDKPPTKEELGTRQKVTRIPPYRTGDWVKIKDEEDVPQHLRGKVRKVRSLVCSFAEVGQKEGIWRVIFEAGSQLEWHGIQGFATEDQIRQAVLRPD